MLDNIAQFYKDHFDLSDEDRQKLVRGYTKDKKERQVYDIKPGDKFIADIEFGCSYLVMTTEKTFEVYPGQSFFGIIILEDNNTGGVRPYMLYACGEKITMQDDDDRPWEIVDKDGALIDYPSTLNDFNTYESLKHTIGFMYWYKAYGVDSYNHLEDAGLSVTQIYAMCDDDPRLKRWDEALNGDNQKRRGRPKARREKTIPQLPGYVQMIRRKFREVKYDEATKSLCF